jgi:hypothetical protein
MARCVKEILKAEDELFTEYGTDGRGQQRSTALAVGVSTGTRSPSHLAALAVFHDGRGSLHREAGFRTQTACSSSRAFDFSTTLRRRVMQPSRWLLVCRCLLVTALLLVRKTGLQAEPVTIAGPLKNNGYATGQFSKNHLGGKYSREQTKPTHQVDLRSKQRTVACRLDHRS